MPKKAVDQKSTQVHAGLILLIFSVGQLVAFEHYKIFSAESFGYGIGFSLISFIAYILCVRKLQPSFSENKPRFITGGVLAALIFGLAFYGMSQNGDLQAIDTTVDSENQASISGAKVDYKITYDPTEWFLTKGASGSAIEYKFNDAALDMYAAVIPQNVQLPIDTLRQSVIDNATAFGPDSKVTFEDTELINGKNFLVMQIEGTHEGAAFTYYGYYYTGVEGTIQFVTYTASDSFAQHKAAMIALLNGLTL